MKKLAIILGLCAMCMAQVNAHLISGPEGPQAGNPSDEADAGELALGLTDLEFLYKIAFPNEEDGDYGAYFTVTDNDDGTADVSWDLTGSGKELWAVAVKTGNLIHWYSVSDDQHIMSAGVEEVTAPDEKDSISHISFFGKGAQTRTPDGGATAALLGLSLLGVGSFSRKFRK